MNKNIYLSTIGIIVILAFAFLSNSYQDNPLEELVKGEEIQILTIAACPTFHDVLENTQGYLLVKTESTLDSLRLLSEGSVDAVVAGRILYPQEYQFKSLILDGEVDYSFLSKESLIIYPEDLENTQFYTDLDVEDVNSIFGIVNLIKVDNVYESLEEGVVITSWENTDLKQANIVHVLNVDGTRNKNSRIPILYYQDLENIEELVSNLSI